MLLKTKYMTRDLFSWRCIYSKNSSRSNPGVKLFTLTFLEQKLNWKGTQCIPSRMRSWQQISESVSESLLWEMVVYLKLQLCWWQWGATWLLGGDRGHSVSIWCGTDWQETWRFDEVKQQSTKSTGGGEKRDNVPYNRCVQKVTPTPTCDSAVMWSGMLALSVSGLAVFDATSYRARKSDGAVTKVLFYSHSSLPHTCTNTQHPQSVPFTAISLALSVLSVQPWCHPLSLAP